MKEILINTNATPILKQEDTGYICWYCKSSYLDPAELKKHCFDKHADQKNPVTSYSKKGKIIYCSKLDITNLTCNLCNTKIDTLDNLLTHLQVKHDRSVHTGIKNQIVPCKFEGLKINCCFCLVSFEKIRKLQEHMHIHYRNYICKECDAGFMTPKCLLTHGEKHKLGTFQCSFCPKIYDTLRKKKMHEKSVHTLVNALNVCGFCNERFGNNHQKNKHLEAVHGIEPRNIKCQACDRTFKNYGSLRIHTRRDHLMERKYACTQCEMTFFSANLLRLHMLKHTGIKEFECDVCHKTYGKKFTLKEHMRIHNDDRRFKCEICGQAFVQKCSLKGHMKNRHGQNV